ncbi:hypothetical protein BH23PLA1_BH23PLA1_13140 [soil metagenome]
MSSDPKRLSALARKGLTDVTRTGQDRARSGEYTQGLRSAGVPEPGALLIDEVNLMHCVFCEAPVAAGMRYCPLCGTFLNSPVATGPASPEKPYPGGMESAKPFAFAYDPPSAPRIPSETSAAAVVSLVAGILAWTVIPVLPAIVAIVSGHQARQAIDSSGGRLTGTSMARTGLFLGYSQVVLIMLVVVIGMAFLGLAVFLG